MNYIEKSSCYLRTFKKPHTKKTAHLKTFTLMEQKNYHDEFVLEHNVIKEITLCGNLEIREQIVKYEGYFIFPLSNLPFLDVCEHAD